ncbi:MAG: uncharacterized protein QOH84_2190 [Kribbellaceae bacterium]|nr:uncharacterized protein [Kribbellaceae bacterium]
MRLWSGDGSWHAEAVRLQLDEDRLTASGTQFGADPLPYRVDYELETGAQWVTRRLHVDAVGNGWSRSLELLSDESGHWTCSTSADGDADLPTPGGNLAAVTGALDCDLAYSPLTNLMPVRRHDLHRQAGTVDFLMAWVSLPDLAVHASPQRYEALGSDENSALVRYISLDTDFAADLQLDADGLVTHYPGIATRIG